MPTTINPSNQTIAQYNVQSGGANNTLNNIAPGTTGYALTSNGASAQPSFQVLPVSGGGTGGATAVPYEVVCGGTTSTGPFQQVSGLGTAGQVLTSAGPGALPTWQNNGGGAGNFVVVTGGPLNLNPGAFVNIYDFTGLNFAICDFRYLFQGNGGGSGTGNNWFSTSICWSPSGNSNNKYIRGYTTNDGFSRFSGNILQLYNNPVAGPYLASWEFTILFKY